MVGWVHARVLSELGGSVGAQERAAGGAAQGRARGEPRVARARERRGSAVWRAVRRRHRTKIAPDLEKGGAGVAGRAGRGSGKQARRGGGGARAPGIERWGRPSGRARVANVLGARARERAGKGAHRTGSISSGASALLTSGAPARVGRAPPEMREARALRESACPGAGSAGDRSPRATSRSAPPPRATRQSARVPDEQRVDETAPDEKQQSAPLCGSRGASRSRG